MLDQATIGHDLQHVLNYGMRDRRNVPAKFQETTVVIALRPQAMDHKTYRPMRIAFP